MYPLWITAILPVSHDGGVDQAVPNDGGEKQSNSGWILEVKSAWSVRDWVWVSLLRRERRREMKVTPRFWPEQLRGVCELRRRSLGESRFGEKLRSFLWACEPCEVGQTPESRNRQPGGGPGGTNGGWAEVVIHL